MFIVRTLKWIVAIFFIVTTAAVFYLSFADLNWLKPHIESAVAKATGRELKLKGNFDLNLVPSPSVTLEDVSLSNADWGSDPIMAEVGHFSTEIGLLSLISGPIRVHSLRLNDVDVLLEKNQQEMANWKLEKENSEDQEATEDSNSGSSASGGLPVIIEFAEVQNVKVTYKEPKAKPTIAYLESLDIKIDEATYMSIKASGEINKQPVKLTARLGPEKAMGTGLGMDVDLEPTYGKYSLKASGNLDVVVDDLLLHNWAIQYKDTETHLAGNVARSPDSNTRLNIEVAGPSLASLEPTLPAIAFKTALVANFVDKQLLLDAIETTFGDSDLSGNMQVKLGDKTAVSGELNSKRLELTPFATGEETGKEGTKKTTEKDEKGQKKSKYVFVEEPLPLQALYSMDLDLKTKVDQLIFQDITLKNVANNINLKDGDLHYTNSFSDLRKGRSVSDIKFTTSGKVAKLDMNINVRNMRINLLSGDGADPSIIPLMGITVDLKAAGKSPRTLAESSSGRLLVTQGKGKIESGQVGKVSGDVVAQLFSALNPFAKQDKYTDLDCTILGLEMNRGKTKITSMLFETDKIKAMGVGDIDLNNEALNMEFETQPRKGVGITTDMFVTPFVKLTGTLANPSISLNKKGVLLKGGAAVATGGLSLLAEGAADRVAGGKDSCSEILAETGGHPAIEK